MVVFIHVYTLLARHLPQVPGIQDPRNGRRFDPSLTVTIEHSSWGLSWLSFRRRMLGMVINTCNSYALIMIPYTTDFFFSFNFFFLVFFFFFFLLNQHIQGLPKKNGDPRLFSNFLAIRNH